MLARDVGVLSEVGGLTHCMHPLLGGHLHVVEESRSNSCSNELWRGSRPQPAGILLLVLPPVPQAVSYTPWPVEEGVEGERLRLDVGVVGERQPRTFVFSKVGGWCWV